MEKSLNQVFNYLENYSKLNVLIKEFKIGTIKQLDDYLRENDKYPFFYVIPLSIDYKTNTVVYTLELRCYDTRSKVVDNLIDVLSDTAQVLNDFRKYAIYNNNKQLWVNDLDTFRLYPLVNDTNNWLSGWRVVVNIETALVENDCLTDLMQNDD